MITDSYRTVARSWRPGHADRPQQAELPGALEDRERQGVGDAEQGDEHGQGEQGVDEVEDHVDVARPAASANSSRSCTSASG